MAYPRLPDEEVFRIRSLFQQTGSLSKVQELTKHNWRTVKRYTEAQGKPKTDQIRVVELYKATGRLIDVADILDISKTTVWRILKGLGISVGSGSSTWVQLYKTLRQRIYRSKWRVEILERDNRCCRNCGARSEHVHHEIRLAQIRNNVLRDHPELDPLRSYQELRRFTDLVVGAHQGVPGIVLCPDCHDMIHSNVNP